MKWMAWLCQIWTPQKQMQPAVYSYSYGYSYRDDTTTAVTNTIKFKLPVPRGRVRLELARTVSKCMFDLIRSVVVMLSSDS